METSADIQLLSSSSVAVSTSQDFDDNATITAFWEKNNTTVGVSGSLHQREIEKKKTILLTFSNPMAQSLSILNVYSRLETGAPA